MVVLPPSTFTRHFVGDLYAHHVGYIDINASGRHDPVYNGDIAATVVCDAFLHTKNVIHGGNE